MNFKFFSNYTNKLILRINSPILKIQKIHLGKTIRKSYCLKYDGYDSDIGINESRLHSKRHCCKCRNK